MDCEIQKVIQVDLSEVFLFKLSQYAAKMTFNSLGSHRLHHRKAILFQLMSFLSIEEKMRKKEISRLLCASQTADLYLSLYFV